MLPAVACLCLLAVLLVRQGVLHVPVPTRPLAGEVHRGPVLRPSWNPVAEGAVHIQMCRDRACREVVFETRASGRWFLTTPPVFTEPGTYYWRMRSIRGGKSSPWTRGIRFRVE